MKMVRRCKPHGLNHQEVEGTDPGKYPESPDSGKTYHHLTGNTAFFNPAYPKGCEVLMNLVFNKN